MRLIRLRVKNIASLKNEHVVDFKAIGNESPLFAITGETGSGKSTLLNAIGLALYGKVYKSNVNQTDVVTLGEKDGQIELIFQVAGKNYIADWRAKVRKQNGELLKAPQTQRSVQHLAGDEFDSIRGEVIESVDQLLNLDFDQFCKCIILNQGEFARFLSSSFTERKEILEKLYPGELLDSLSRELKAELDSHKISLSEVNTQLLTMKGENLSGEDLKKEKKKLHTEANLFDGWLKKMESLEYHFTSLYSYHEQFAENKKKSDLIKASISEATTKYNHALKESQKLTESYQEIKDKQEKELPRLQELLKSEETLKHHLSTSSQLQKKISEISEHFEKLNQDKTRLIEEYIQWKKTHETLSQGISSPIPELKAHRENLEALFELQNELESLEKEKSSSEVRLKELEAQGKELAQELLKVQNKIKEIPQDIILQLESLRKKKLEFQKLQERRQKNEIRFLDLKKQIAEQEQELILGQKKDQALIEKSVLHQQELSALETTLKLQELKGAVEMCLTHAQSSHMDECPVCHTPAQKDQWSALLMTLEKTDTQKIKTRSIEISHLLISAQEELKLLSALTKTLKDSLTIKKKEVSELEGELKTPLNSLEDLEAQLESQGKLAWELESFKKEEVKAQSELNRAREAYSHSKKEYLRAQETLSAKLDSQKLLLGQLRTLIASELTKELLQRLKDDLRSLTQFIQSEVRGDKLIQEQSFIEKNLETLSQQHKTSQSENQELQKKIMGLDSLLKKELGEEKVVHLIEKLNQEVKQRSEEWNKGEKELKLHELALKDFQSRLYTLDEHIKDLDVQFSKELHQIKEEAIIALPAISEELTTLTERLKFLALDFNSPVSLFISLKELLSSQKDELKEKTQELKMNHARISERLEQWEKLQDKIQILEMKREDLKKVIERQERLSLVLGKDELRSYVLSLVEENLIVQTNEELQKLCQGRYEIVHQARGKGIIPEFYILDKYREGGRRKVSTLSGGETFMVSLAMALALAEMTRGQAEIDSLFIDEGFGTLDQDSLEDVLDMLNQIQTRGLMVGIISHIKPLTNSLPVNLMLNKRQDGTSTLSIQYN
jgi:exonuclease SbcC